MPIRQLGGQFVGVRLWDGSIVLLFPNSERPPAVGCRRTKPGIWGCACPAKTTNETRIAVSVRPRHCGHSSASSPPPVAVHGLWGYQWSQQEAASSRVFETRMQFTGIGSVPMSWIASTDSRWRRKKAIPPRSHQTDPRKRARMTGPSHHLMEMGWPAVAQPQPPPWLLLRSVPSHNLDSLPPSVGGDNWVKHAVHPLSVPVAVVSTPLDMIAHFPRETHVAHGVLEDLNQPR